MVDDLNWQVWDLRSNFVSWLSESRYGRDSEFSVRLTKLELNQLGHILITTTRFVSSWYEHVLDNSQFVWNSIDFKDFILTPFFRHYLATTYTPKNPKKMVKEVWTAPGVFFLLTTSNPCFWNSRDFTDVILVSSHYKKQAINPCNFCC